MYFHSHADKTKTRQIGKQPIKKMSFRNAHNQKNATSEKTHGVFFRKLLDKTVKFCEAKLNGASAMQIKKTLR